MNKTTTQLRQAKRTSVDTGSIPRSRASAKPKAQPPKSTIQEKLQALLEEHRGELPMLPSWKRVAAATFVTVALSAGAGYGIGTIATYAMVGVMTLTGSVLMSFMVLVLAMLLAAYVGFKIGQHVGNYILSGQIDRDIVATKNKVVGFFKRSDLVTA